MTSDTRSLLATAPAPTGAGWLARAIFALLCVLIGAELFVVMWLVAFTFMRLTDDYQPATGMAPHGAFAVPLLGDNPQPVEVGVWDHHGPLNVLLIGLDADDCAVTGSTTMARRADTIIVVRIDPRTKRAAMLSIPRDLYVSVPGHGGRKINTAHVHGELDGTPGGGPALLVQTVAENLDIPIHRYARIDFAGFKNMIDAVGGIDVDVPPSRNDPTVGLYDAEYPDGHCGVMTVSFAPGLQHMDGDQALQYARSRKTTSDFDRSRRQMEVLMALREKAMSLGALKRVPQLVPALLDTVDTDFTTGELVSLARIVPAIDTRNVLSYHIDQTVLYDEMLLIDDVPQSVLRLDPDAYEGLRQRFMDMVEPTPTPGPTATATMPAPQGEPAG